MYSGNPASESGVGLRIGTMRSGHPFDESRSLGVDTSSTEVRSGNAMKTTNQSWKYARCFQYCYVITYPQADQIGERELHVL